MGVLFPDIIMAAPHESGKEPFNEIIHVSDEIIYPEMEGIDTVPQSAWIWAWDAQTGKGRKVLLPLKEYHFSNKHWKDGFRLDITVTNYGGEGYLLGDELIKGGEAPLLSGHEKGLLSQAGLNAEAYRIEKLQWKGEPYEKDGVMCRNLAAAGSKLVADCNAIYGGDVNKIIFADTDMVQDGDIGASAKNEWERAGGGHRAGNSGKAEWGRGNVILLILLLTLVVLILTIKSTWLKKGKHRDRPEIICPKRAGTPLSVNVHRLLPALFLAGFLASAGWLLKTAVGYGECRDYYSDLCNVAYADKGEEARRHGPVQLSQTDIAVRPANHVLDVTEYPPDIHEADLRKINPDYKCWISIPGAGIEYPVVQHEDNQYYLTHNFNGEEHRAGSIFADSAVVPFAGDNTIIYGHNMKDGSMFGGLKKYRDQSFFQKNPRIMVFSQGKWRECPVFSCQIRSENDAGAYRTNLMQEEWARFLEEMKRLSIYDTGVIPLGDEHLITLSTCLNKNQRLIVQALLNHNP